MSMKIRALVTCGATWTPIDDVRVISNVSTGETGHLIACALRSAGARVTVIEGPVAYPLLDRGIKIIKYRFFDQLAKLLKREVLQKYDIVIHAAAVSDFKVPRSHKNKIASSKTLTLRLVATPKLIESIKTLSPKSVLVGFKLESKLNPKNIFKTAQALFSRCGCDLVVANTLKNGYRGFILNPDGKILAKADNKRSMAQKLVKLIL